ncbi:MAG: hypothetical protein RIS64_622 [Bacteroidota bacterium]|jgi:ribA/ribD-fused uncharacterized protein
MKYNVQQFVARQMMGEKLNFLFFWGHRPARDGRITPSCFSQWWAENPFKVGDMVYQTAEHWMMAEKARLFGDKHHEQLILKANSPGAAKALGRKIQNFDDVIWNQAKFNIVKIGNIHKFSQPNLANFLLATGDTILVEASPTDSIWGIGMEATHPSAPFVQAWRGENLLGFALMEVREDLLQNQN